MTKRMMKKIPGHPIYHAGKKMHWTTGHAVWNMGGIVFLSGSEGRDPDTDIPRPGIKAQAKLALERIKARLEEFGTSLDNILHLTYYVVGPDFPNGVQEDEALFLDPGEPDDGYPRDVVGQVQRAAGLHVVQTHQPGVE